MRTNQIINAIVYLKGKFSLEQAAKFVDIHIGEFYEQMRAKEIESNLTLEDFDESLKHAKRLK